MALGDPAEAWARTLLVRVAAHVTNLDLIEQSSARSPCSTISISTPSPIAARRRRSLQQTDFGCCAGRGADIRGAPSRRRLVVDVSTMRQSRLDFAG